MDKYEFQLKKQRLDIWQGLITSLAKWVPLCVIAFFAYLSIAALAGKTTLTQFQMMLISNLKLNKGLGHGAWGLFGTGGVTYGVLERQLRRKKVKRMGDRIKILEEKIDPKRSSSSLTRDGRTRPEDRI